MEKLIEEELRKATPSPTPSARSLEPVPQAPPVSRLPVIVPRRGNRINHFPANAPIAPPPRVPNRQSFERYRNPSKRNMDDSNGMQSFNGVSLANSPSRSDQEISDRVEKLTLTSSVDAGNASNQDVVKSHIDEGSSTKDKSSDATHLADEPASTEYQVNESNIERFFNPEVPDERFSKYCAARYYLAPSNRINRDSVETARPSSGEMNFELRTKRSSEDSETKVDETSKFSSKHTTLSSLDEYILSAQERDQQQEQQRQAQSTTTTYINGKPVFGPPRPPVDQVKTPVGFRTDIIEFNKFRKMFEHSLPSNIQVFAVIIEFDVTFGYAFMWEGHLYAALGQRFELRRITKPTSAKELLDILTDYSFNQAMATSPGLTMPTVLTEERETMIELCDPDEITVFQDKERDRIVAITNLHKYAVLEGEDWINQKCDCEMCMDPNEYSLD